MIETLQSIASRVTLHDLLEVDDGFYVDVKSIKNSAGKYLIMGVDGDGKNTKVVIPLSGDGTLEAVEDGEKISIKFKKMRIVGDDDRLASVLNKRTSTRLQALGAAMSNVDAETPFILDDLKQLLNILGTTREFKHNPMSGAISVTVEVGTQKTVKISGYLRNNTLYFDSEVTLKQAGLVFEIPYEGHQNAAKEFRLLMEGR